MAGERYFRSRVYHSLLFLVLGLKLSAEVHTPQTLPFKDRSSWDAPWGFNEMLISVMLIVFFTCNYPVSRNCLFSLFSLNECCFWRWFYLCKGMKNVVYSKFYQRDPPLKIVSLSYFHWCILCHVNKILFSMLLCDLGLLKVLFIGWLCPASVCI